MNSKKTNNSVSWAIHLGANVKAGSWENKMDELVVIRFEIRNFRRKVVSMVVPSLTMMSKESATFCRYWHSL